MSKSILVLLITYHCLLITALYASRSISACESAGGAAHRGAGDVRGGRGRSERRGGALFAHGEGGRRDRSATAAPSLDRPRRRASRNAQRLESRIVHALRDRPRRATQR